MVTTRCEGCRKNSKESKVEKRFHEKGGRPFKQLTASKEGSKREGLENKNVALRAAHLKRGSKGKGTFFRTKPSHTTPEIAPIIRENPGARGGQRPKTRRCAGGNG